MGLSRDPLYVGLATPSPRAVVMRGKRRRPYEDDSSSDDASYSDDSEDDVYYGKYVFIKTLAKQMIHVSEGRAEFVCVSVCRRTLPWPNTCTY